MDEIPSYIEIGAKNQRDNGYSSGYLTGYNKGNSEGYDTGYDAGKKEGNQYQYDSGYSSGKSDGYKSGYDDGYSAGYNTGSSSRAGQSTSTVKTQTWDTALHTFGHVKSGVTEYFHFIGSKVRFYNGNGGYSKYIDMPLNTAKSVTVGGVTFSVTRKSGVTDPGGLSTYTLTTTTSGIDVCFDAMEPNDGIVTYPSKCTGADLTKIYAPANMDVDAATSKKYLINGGLANGDTFGGYRVSVRGEIGYKSDAGTYEGYPKQSTNTYVVATSGTKSNITIENMIVDRANVGNIGGLKDSVIKNIFARSYEFMYFGSCENIKIQDCTWVSAGFSYNGTNDVFYMGGDNNGVTIENCRFVLDAYNQKGWRFGGSGDRGANKNVVVRNCDLLGDFAYAVYITKNDQSTGQKFYNCNFLTMGDHLSGMIYAGLAGTAPYFENCVFYSKKGGTIAGTAEPIFKNCSFIGFGTTESVVKSKAKNGTFTNCKYYATLSAYTSDSTNVIGNSASNEDSGSTSGTVALYTTMTNARITNRPASIKSGDALDIDIAYTGSLTEYSATMSGTGTIKMTVDNNDKTINVTSSNVTGDITIITKATGSAAVNYDEVLVGTSDGKVGALSKPTFMFVSDDGFAEDTYAIDEIVKGMGVPMTFAPISASSQLISDATNLAKLKDAIDNYGCAVAVHGNDNWTTTSDLSAYFTSYKSGMTAKGITVYGSVYPNGNYNDTAISKLKSVTSCAFALSTKTNGSYTDGEPYQGISGSTTSLWKLQRQSLMSAYVMSVVKKNFTENGLCAIYWHGNNLKNGGSNSAGVAYTNEQLMDIIREVVDYVKANGGQFVTTRNIYGRK